MTKPLSEPLLDAILPKINNAIPNALHGQGLTREGLLSIVFPNAEELFNTQWWAKFMEKYAKSPIVELFKGLNIQFFPELKKILPGIAEGRGGKGR